MSASPRIVIAGGGFGGLETACLLRMRIHDEGDIALISDRISFLFKPNTIYIPFGGLIEPLLIDLEEPLRKRHVSFFNASVPGVDPDKRTVSMADRTVLH